MYNARLQLVLRGVQNEYRCKVRAYENLKASLFPFLRNLLLLSLFSYLSLLTTTVFKEWEKTLVLIGLGSIFSLLFCRKVINLVLLKREIEQYQELVNIGLTALNSKNHGLARILTAKFMSTYSNLKHIPETKDPIVIRSVS